jgi:hypothetical protein
MVLTTWPACSPIAGTINMVLKPPLIIANRRISDQIANALIIID